MSIGWERSNRTHFDDIVIKYDDIRPAYPNELLCDIFAYTDSTASGKNALEIGAGTGKATAPFLNAGYDVTAVEIGENMSEFLYRRFDGNKHFNVITSAFEDAPLPEDNYDLIYAASAFHWVEAAIGCPKVFHLLKHGGVFALFRYNAVPADGEKLYEDIQSVYEKYYHKPYKRPVRVSKKEYENTSEIYRGFRFNDLREYGFKDVKMKLYESARIFNTDEYMLLLDTFSDHRALPDNDRASLKSGIRQAIESNGGHIKVDYVFQLYTGMKI